MTGGPDRQDCGNRPKLAIDGKQGSLVALPPSNQQRTVTAVLRYRHSSSGLVEYPAEAAVVAWLTTAAVGLPAALFGQSVEPLPVAVPVALLVHYYPDPPKPAGQRQFEAPSNASRSHEAVITRRRVARPTTAA